MRYFSRLVREMQEIVATHEVGTTVPHPSLLQREEIDGINLAYMQMGLAHTDRPIILMHGFGGFFMDWPRIMVPASKERHLFAVDLPGWGFSDFNPNARGIEADVEIIHKFIMRKGLKNVVLCGISYGAGVAWAAAAMHLTEISHADLLNQMPPNPLKYMQSMLYRSIFALNFSRWSTHLAHKMMAKIHFRQICKESLLHFRLIDSFYLELGYRVIKQPKIPNILNLHSKGARQVDWRAWENRLGSIKIPVTILQGKQDRIFSMEGAKYLHSLIPASNYIEVDDCGHAMVFDQHRKVVEFLLKHT